jgi:hypothetical protein
MPSGHDYFHVTLLARLSRAAVARQRGQEGPSERTSAKHQARRERLIHRISHLPKTTELRIREGDPPVSPSGG